jgi:hypothetical protein
MKKVTVFSSSFWTFCEIFFVSKDSWSHPKDTNNFLCLDFFGGGVSCCYCLLWFALTPDQTDKRQFYGSNDQIKLVQQKQQIRNSSINKRYFIKYNLFTKKKKKKKEYVLQTLFYQIKLVQQKQPIRNSTIYKRYFIRNKKDYGLQM